MAPADGWSMLGSPWRAQSRRPKAIQVPPIHLFNPASAPFFQPCEMTTSKKQKESSMIPMSW